MRQFAAYPAIEGAPVNNNLFASMLAGEGAFSAGPSGLIIGRFGWADPVTGQVVNLRGTNGAALGFVLPIWGTWERLYCGENGVWILRSGQRCVLAAKGDFWCRFAGGAWPGQTVFANITDGSASAATPAESPAWTADSDIVTADSPSYTAEGGGTLAPGWTADSDTVTADSIFYTADGGGYQLTQYRVMTPAPPGALAVISPWSSFSPMH